MKLKKLKKMFEPLTRGGRQYKILGQKNGFITITVKAGDWIILNLSKNGRVYTDEISINDLIPIKKEEPKKPIIDYSKLPKDVLCAINGYVDFLRYTTGDGTFYFTGRDSFTHQDTKQSAPIKTTTIKIIDNPVRPVIGNILNEIPDNVRITLSILDTFQGREEVAHSPITGLMQDFCSRQKGTAIFYQILGE